MDGFRKCPECAEMVREEARKCRFCGYRLDGRRQAGVLDFIVRRPDPDLSVDELVREWGMDLAAGETVAFFGFCGLEGRDGYLLVSSVRVAFFAGRRSERVLEWPVAALRDVALDGGWRRRGLRMSGPGGSVTLRRFDSRRALADAARLLGAPRD